MNDALAAMGCEVAASDATRRPRPDGLDFTQTVAGLKQDYPQVLVMTDGSRRSPHLVRKPIS